MAKAMISLINLSVKILLFLDFLSASKGLLNDLFLLIFGIFWLEYYREKREMFKGLHPFLDSLLIIQPISNQKNKNTSIPHKSSGENNQRLDGLLAQGG